MKIGILIGFQYCNDMFCEQIFEREGKFENLYLPGIIIDLYQSYKFVKNMKPDKILIITDIYEDQKTSLLMKSIVEDIVDSDILTFIETIKNTNEYHKYKDLKNFINTISLTCYNQNNIFIYYTGHAKNGYLLLPSIEKYPMSDFRELISNSTYHLANIFIVMDCCNGSCLNLPFKLEINKSPVYKLVNDTKLFFTKQNIICIVSSLNNENAITSKNGSIFTRAFFKSIKSCNRLLSKILIDITSYCSQQTPCIYSSYPNIYLIWNWLLNPSNYDITIDNINNHILISTNHIINNVSDICFIDYNI